MPVIELDQADIDEYQKAAHEFQEARRKFWRKVYEAESELR